MDTAEIMNTPRKTNNNGTNHADGDTIHESTNTSQNINEVNQDTRINQDELQDNVCINNKQTIRYINHFCRLFASSVIEVSYNIKKHCFGYH
jgi:hypothetical protein